MKIEYPKYLYHASKPPQIVNDAEEHKAMGAEWSEAPGSAPAKPTKPEGKKASAAKE